MYKCTGCGATQDTEGVCLQCGQLVEAVGSDGAETMPEGFQEESSDSSGETM